ncbi:hypothetical protein M8C21_029941 [Ambrosia artemisiifolia]|uniref:Uncharacterized protein n=1 Tax=Ambrosia artemisiifolia TaxID=4212 RepID=A0AAD5GH08_AMBAR|nr:hypothetical protein M8C21_029941 [Ambrosia artemisiifolia]
MEEGLKRFKAQPASSPVRGASVKSHGFMKGSF